IENEGYDYLGEAQSVHGIWDTLILGYTDKENEIYYEISEKFKTLKISGYEFEKTLDLPYKQKLMIYQFEFENAKEMGKFESFQKYILNYQRHSKNNVDFYKKDENWYLRFEPMP